MELLEVSVENVITIGLITILTLMAWSLFMSMFTFGDQEPDADAG